MFLSFLNSGILFLSAAVIVPILIYLFISKKPKRIIFSTIRHIKASQKKQKSKIKLKNLLLLIIRCLIILLTILALARPALRTPLLHRWSRHSQTAVAIILDTSYSMDYLVDTRTELEIGKNLIKEINEQLTERDITVLITSDNEWNQLYSSLHYGSIPETILGTIDITAVPLPLSELIELANQRLLESQILNREIYVISDFRKQEIPADLTYPLFFIPTSDIEERNNLSSQNARLVEDFVEKKIEHRIAFEVVNHSPFVQQDVICQLFVNDRTVAEKVVNLQPRQRLTEHFDIRVEESGWYNGYVSVRNERLPFDNRSYFAFFSDQEPQVAVITDRGELPLPMLSILEIFSGDLRNVDIIQDDNLNYERIESNSFVILYDKGNFSPRLQFLFDRLKRENKGVLHLLTEDLSTDWQDYYQEVFDIDFLNYTEGQNQRVTYVNRYHPVMTVFSEDDMQLVELRSYWRSRPRGRANVLLQTDQYPLVLENERELLWLFDVSDLQNRIILDPMFPIMAYRTFLYCSNIDYPLTKVGERITLPTGQILLPNEELFTTNEQSFLLSEPGIYELPLASAQSRFLAVNIDYSFSDYERFDPEDLQSDKVIFLGENWQEEILRSRYGFEIWKYLFALVLLLIVLEILLVKKEERRG
ncbi:MAG: BatA domain-containing protein [Candidatus Cloacimonetes bacterium]|nr:BatA domain-containing protein [Candidatus Cloacimonadota bacterium]